MEEPRGEDDRCREYRSGIATAPGFITAGFGQLFLVMASQRILHLPKIRSLTVACPDLDKNRELCTRYAILFPFFLPPGSYLGLYRGNHVAHPGRSWRYHPAYRIGAFHHRMEGGHRQPAAVERRAVAGCL